MYCIWITKHGKIPHPIYKYCSLRPDILQTIKSKFPQVFGILEKLPGEWMLVGNFVSHLIDPTKNPTFENNIGVVYFDDNFSRKNKDPDLWTEHPRWGAYTRKIQDYKIWVVQVFGRSAHPRYQQEMLTFNKRLPKYPIEFETFDAMRVFSTGRLGNQAFCLQNCMFLDCDFVAPRNAIDGQDRPNVMHPTQPKRLEYMAFECAAENALKFHKRNMVRKSFRFDNLRQLCGPYGFSQVDGYRRRRRDH